MHSQSEKLEHILCKLDARLIAMVVQHWVLLTAVFSILLHSLPQGASAVRVHGGQLAEAVNTRRGIGAVVDKVRRALPPPGRVTRQGAGAPPMNSWRRSPEP